MNPDVLYYTVQGERRWDVWILMFSPPSLPLLGELPMVAEPLGAFFDTPDDPDESGFLDEAIYSDVSDE